jgi:hypothetical protein
VADEKLVACIDIGDPSDGDQAIFFFLVSLAKQIIVVVVTLIMKRGIYILYI